jgi:hypothetical protein
VAVTHHSSEESGVGGFRVAGGGDVGLILGFPGGWIGDLNYLIFFSTIIRCHSKVAYIYIDS